MQNSPSSLSSTLLGANDLRAVFDAIEAGCCVIELLYDADGQAVDYRFLAVNAAFEAQSGLQGAEGKRVHEVIPRFERHWFEVYDRVIRTGRSARVTEEASGLGRWFQVSASRLGGSDSRKLVLLFEDVTAEKASRDALADAQTRLAATLAANEIATWTWDVQRDAVVADRNLARLFGVADEAAAGGPIAAYFERIHPEDRARVQDVIGSALESGTGYEAEYRIVRADHDIRWVIARGRIDRDADGRPARLPGVVLDVTHGKSAEQALRLAETRLHFALRAGHMGTWELGLPGGRLQHCSAVTKSNFGRAPDAHFTYEDLLAALHEQDRPAWQQAIAAATPAPNGGEGSSSFEVEARVRWPDGSWHWISVRSESGGPEHARILSGVTVLIDQRKHAEASLRHADRERDEFLATASHELRTPLTAILGWARLLRAGKLDKSQALRGVEVIERNALAQVRLIEDILDGSRIITGKLRLEVRAVDLSILVTLALDAVRADARRDDRLRTHAARDTVLSYCGVLLRDPVGRPFGTLCHFDLVPSEVAVHEIPLMEAAAKSFVRALSESASTRRVSPPHLGSPVDDG